MKKIIIGLVAFMFLAMSGIQDAKALEVIGFNAGFKRASTGCESGFGLCAKVVILETWTWVWGFRGNESSLVGAKSSIDEKKNIYILTFSERELKEKDPIAYEAMGKGKFYLDEDITLPKEANKVYGLSRTGEITIKKGVYDVKIKGDVVTIEIPIK